MIVALGNLLPVAKISDLILVQAVKAVIPSTEVSLLVLPLRVDDTSNGQDQNANLADQVDCVTSWVLWCVFRNVCPGRENTTSCAERNDVCCGNGPYGWVSGVVGRPCEETGASRESTDCDQENSSITDVGVSDPSQNSEASDCGDRKDGKVDTATVCLVTNESNGDGNKTGAYVGRDGVELSFGGGPTKIVENGGLGDSQH